MGWETFGKCNMLKFNHFLHQTSVIIYTHALNNIENYQGSYLFFNFFPSSFEAGRIIALYGPSTYKEFSPQLLTSYSSLSFVKTAGKNWTLNGDHLPSINNECTSNTHNKKTISIKKSYWSQDNYWKEYLKKYGILTPNFICQIFWICKFMVLIICVAVL